MGYVNNNLWKPQPGDIPEKKLYKKNKKNNKKKNKQTKARKRREKIRSDLLNHFGLNKYATNIAICLCIHKKTEHPMPENDRQTKRIMEDYWRTLNGNTFLKRKFLNSEEFYKSRKWKELRYIALQQSDGTCTLCGARASDGVSLHVDHIIPHSKRPELQYDLDNLQILCEDCNLGKSNYDDTDFRSLG